MGRKHNDNHSRSQRQLKLGEMIRHALSEIFLRVEIRDDDLTGIILTVSEVRVSPDARKAMAYISPLAVEDRESVIEALTRHRKFLRGELSRRVHLKYVPDIHFQLDPVFEQAESIDKLLKSDKVSQDLQ